MKKTICDLCGAEIPKDEDYKGAYTAQVETIHGFINFSIRMTSEQDVHKDCLLKTLKEVAELKKHTTALIPDPSDDFDPRYFARGMFDPDLNAKQMERPRNYGPRLR